MSNYRSADIGSAVSPLVGLDTVINITIEDFGLDNLKLSEMEAYDLVHRFTMIYDVLIHTRNAIQDTLTNIQPFIDDLEN